MQTQTQTSSSVFSLSDLVGKKIRSFDFTGTIKGEMWGTDLTGEEAFYCEGIVISVGHGQMLKIETTREVWEGEDQCISKKIFFTPLLEDGYGDNRLKTGSLQILQIID